MRDERLNESLFLGLDQARLLIDAWVTDCKTAKPHSSLGYKRTAPRRRANIGRGTSRRWMKVNCGASISANARKLRRASNELGVDWGTHRTNHRFRGAQGAFERKCGRIVVSRRCRTGVTRKSLAKPCSDRSPRSSPNGQCTTQTIGRLPWLELMRSSASNRQHSTLWHLSLTELEMQA